MHAEAGPSCESGDGALELLLELAGATADLGGSDRAASISGCL